MKRLIALFALVFSFFICGCYTYLAKADVGKKLYEPQPMAPPLYFPVPAPPLFPYPQPLPVPPAKPVNPPDDGEKYKTRPNDNSRKPAPKNERPVRNEDGGRNTNKRR